MHSRPDLAFQTSFLISRIENGTVSALLQANKIIRKVLHSVAECRLTFPKHSPNDKWAIIVYSDASFNNYDDGGTQGGDLVFLASVSDDKVCPCSLLCWRSSRLKRIIRSTLSAETIAMVEAIDAAYLCQQIFNEIWNVEYPIVAVTDSASIVENQYFTTSVCDRPLRVDLGYLRSMISE